MKTKVDDVDEPTAPIEAGGEKAKEYSHVLHTPIPKGVVPAVVIVSMSLT
jgi:hypothetical protein